MNITPLEKKMLENLWKNHFANEEGDPVWSDCWSEGPHDEFCTKAQAPGIISSLMKKGLVEGNGEDGRDGTIWITEEGLKAIKAAQEDVEDEDDDYAGRVIKHHMQEAAWMIIAADDEICNRWSGVEYLPDGLVNMMPPVKEYESREVIAYRNPVSDKEFVTIPGLGSFRCIPRDQAIRVREYEESHQSLIHAKIAIAIGLSLKNYGEPYVVFYNQEKETGRDWLYLDVISEKKAQNVEWIAYQIVARIEGRKVEVF